MFYIHDHTNARVHKASVCKAGIYPSFLFFSKIFSCCFIVEIFSVVNIFSHFLNCSFKTSDGCSFTIIGSKMASYFQRWTFEHFWTIFGQCCTLWQKNWLKIICFLITSPCKVKLTLFLTIFDFLLLKWEEKEEY